MLTSLAARFGVVLVLGNSLLCRALSNQVPVSANLSRGLTGEQDHVAVPYNSGFGSSLDDTVFSTFKHASFPTHGMRIRPAPKPFCDESVRSFTGYLDAGFGTKHFFFYFFESRSLPETDDLVVWLNGGAYISKNCLQLPRFNAS